ncbi:MAG TPA: thioredoxin family protein [Rhodothermales bacterium]
MARTYSLMNELGTPAPDFDLPVANPDASPIGRERVRLADFDRAQVLVVVFTCNHCPYAQHVEDTFIAMAREYADRGVSFVAISSNDPSNYPDDSFESMAARAREKSYPFPYLFDESQQAALAYGAVCTPDPFVYDEDRKLVYRGRFDASRPGMGSSTGKDLREAIDRVLAGELPPESQFPSMGCNIKWKPGNQPAVAAGPVPSEAA